MTQPRGKTLGRGGPCLRAGVMLSTLLTAELADTPTHIDRVVPICSLGSLTARCGRATCTPACGLQAERHSGNATRARGSPERQSGTVASSNGNCAGVLGAITKPPAGT